MKRFLIFPFVRYLIRSIKGIKNILILRIIIKISAKPEFSFFKAEVIKKIVMIIIDKEITKEVTIKVSLPQFFNFLKPNPLIILTTPMVSITRHNCK